MRYGWSSLILAVSLGLSACGGGPASEKAGGERITSTDELQSRNGPTIDVDTHPGKGLFTENCLTCQNGTVPKAPQQVWLEMMAPDAILASMNGGIMSQQAAKLSPAQRQQIAEYLTRTPLADYKPPAPPELCSPQQVKFDASQPPAQNGWGHDNRRFASATQVGLTAEQIPQLKLKWAFAYPAAQRARSQSAVG